MSIAILTLPGTTSLTHGYYGLEECVARGILRIYCPTSEFNVNTLTISLEGKMESAFWDPEIVFDKHKRRTQLIFNTQRILSSRTLFKSGFTDIPFEIPFPPHEAIGHGFGASTQLLPGTLNLYGSTDFLQYSGQITYQLEAKMTIPNGLAFLSSTVSSIIEFPFQVYDPRLILNMLNPIPRQWKSHIRDIPIEYDIEIDSNTVGPGDFINFKYKILVNSTFAQIGLRVHKVMLSLKEYHYVGDARCCFMDDRENWMHGQAQRVMGTLDFPLHSQAEFGGSTLLQYPSTVIYINYSCLKNTTSKIKRNQ